MRLIAVGGKNGIYRAGVEIKLKPGAVTYWRLPGETGVPPQFSFSGSQNLGSAKVLYPAPHRMEEAGFEAWGYRDAVTFPLRLIAKAPSQPVYLDVTVNYAVCQQICIPVKGHAQLALPQLGDGPYKSVLAEARARVPVALSAAQVQQWVAVTPQSVTKGKPHWQIAWAGPASLADVFAEGPEGWAFEAKKTSGKSFTLDTVESPDPIKAKAVSVRLTFAGTPKSFDTTLPLSIPQPVR
jgi:DsbC/DsbD-like thiol-disulfide interchange protein